MVRVRAGAAGLRMDQLQFQPANRFSGDADTIRFSYGPDTYIEFRGSFQYDDEGNLENGTLEQVRAVSGGALGFKATDIDQNVVPVVQFLNNQDFDGLTAFILRGDDRFDGSDVTDRLFGFGGNDDLFGKLGDDALFGGAGDDRLEGGGGGDLLVGGEGRDEMKGGTGADVFSFGALAEVSGDLVEDFSRKQGDKIDLSGIDAIQQGDGDDAFNLAKAFTGKAGQLVVTADGGQFMVQGDVNGDAKADFTFYVQTADGQPPTSADFVF